MAANPFNEKTSRIPNPFNENTNPFPKQSQIKPANLHRVKNGFPKPESLFNEGKRLAQFALQLKQLAANNSFTKVGYTSNGQSPEIWTPWGSHTPNPKFRRVPIQMKQIRVTSLRPLPPRQLPPPKPTGFRKATKIVAGNQFATPDPFADFNHGAVLGYSEAVWKQLNEAQRAYAMIWDFLITEAPDQLHHGDSVVKHPDWAALLHGFMKWATSNDVQQKVRIVWNEYGDFVITVSEAMLRGQGTFRNWLDRLQRHDDPIDARNSATSKTLEVYLNWVKWMDEVYLAQQGR